jgi:xyloglucan-specific exo-beta-1,4-glucanase
MRRSYARRSAASLLVTTVVAAAAAVVSQVIGGPGASAASTESYSWRNVEIGGGGFVPGIIFNRKQKDLIYARTDIGGAYRWNQGTGRWTPLLDFVDQNNWGWNGVVSLATDTVDPNRVYVAAGMYTNSWDPNNGAVLRSADQGKTWKAATLPFKLNGNMPGRGAGERLAIDPNDNRILYLGAPSGKGLWRSVDSGVTWSQVTSFPNAGLFAPDPTDPNGYNNDPLGLLWVTFDPSSGAPGTATNAIYVGVADKDNTVYRSIDAGVTWERLAGQPTGYMAHKGVLDETSHTLYIATSNTGGPYDGSKGDVWKYNTVTGAWTQISPVPSSSSSDGWGYSGLSIDRQHPNTLMVATQISWWPDVVFFRSTDAGATWSRAWDIPAWPNRKNRYVMDISYSPWLDWGVTKAEPEQAIKLGWMTESLEIDPFNSDRMMYGTGATLYGTTELTKWDRNEQFTIKPMVAGLEETNVLDLVSPPSGAPLISALGDIDGFRHDDLTKAPAKLHGGGAKTLDFAESSPNIVIRAADNFFRSADGGSTWTQTANPGGKNGTVAAGADGKTFVWAPSGAPVSSTTDGGATWVAATGIPNEAIVEADRVNPQKFYGFKDGKFYASTDGAKTFAASAATNLPTKSVKFKAVPGAAGDIWLTGDTGLFRSTNSGATFTKLANVTSSLNVGFGKAAPGKTYPAVYTVATVDGTSGVYRSDDAGGRWLRINDDQHQYGNMGAALTGDPRVYGRVYLGTNGRGILVADRPTKICTASYKVNGSWPHGFNAGLVVQNTGSEPITKWTLTWTFPDGQTVTDNWSGALTQSGPNVTVKSLDWNAKLAPNESAQLGFNGQWKNANNLPTDVNCAAS